MSVVVKGMEMPIACHLCPLVRFYRHVPNVWCNGTNKRLMTDFDGNPEVYIGRPEWCPLVELSEKHGRIVDVGPLEVVAYNLKDHEGKTFDDGVEFILEKLDALPTIVEEEGDGD